MQGGAGVSIVYRRGLGRERGGEVTGRTGPRLGLNDRIEETIS